jgi:hypothetical protein
MEELHEVFRYSGGVQCALYSFAHQSNTLVSCQTFSGGVQYVPNTNEFAHKIYYGNSSIQTCEQRSHILWKRTQYSTCFLSPSPHLAAMWLISCPPSLEACYFPPPNLQNIIFSSPFKCVRFISMGPLMLLNTSFKNCHFSSACIYHKFKGHIKSNQLVHIMLQQRYMYKNKHNPYWLKMFCHSFIRSINFC